MLIDFIQFFFQFMLANFLAHYIAMKLTDRNVDAASAWAFVS